MILTMNKQTRDTTLVVDVDELTEIQSALLYSIRLYPKSRPKAHEVYQRIKRAVDYLFAPDSQSSAEPPTTTGLGSGGTSLPPPGAHGTPAVGNPPAVG